jgi:hypothetical protein
MDTPTAAQRPYVFVRGSEGHLWLNWWDGASWHWSDRGVDAGTSLVGWVGVIAVRHDPNAGKRPYALWSAVMVSSAPTGGDQ